MTGPQDPAAGDDRLRASHADRELVIEALQDAFVLGRLTRDELGARVGRALAARTGAELATLTADIPVKPKPAEPRPTRPTVPTGSEPARRWPLAKAAAMSGGCVGIAFAVAWVGGHTDHPLGPSPYKAWMPLCFFVAIVALVAALVIVVHGVVTSVEQRPDPSDDQTRTEMRTRKSRRHSQNGGALRGVRQPRFDRGSGWQPFARRDALADA
jgi:Domain of unknown function (DUF1707)